MIITQLTDLQFQITNLYNSNDEAIRIDNCNSFVAKFYTDSIDNSAVCLKINDELTNIKIEENADYCLINSTDLAKMKDGVLFFQISYSVADESYSDGLFNNVIAGNTNYYISLNNSGENDYYTKEEIDEKLDAIVAGGEIDLSSYYKKSEVDNLLNNKADNSELTAKQDTLISGVNVKTINNQSILGSGNIEIQASTGSTDLSDYYTKEETDSTFATTTQLENKVDKEEGKSLISDEEIDRLATLNNYDDTAINEQIATLNSSKLDVTAYTQDKETFALKTELADYLTVANAAETYQPIGDYLTSIPDEYITESELSESLNDKVDVTAYTQDKSTFALKSEIPDTSNFATTSTVNGIETRLQTVETELSGATELSNNILQMI